MSAAHLLDIYHALENHFGDLHWWPAKTKDEVAIGAILTQNVSWANVEKALALLAEQGLLSLAGINRAPFDQLEHCIVSTRYYKTKAKKLKAFAEYFLTIWHGDWELLQKAGIDKARHGLLGVWGIGPETADDILLYAAELPSFVIDTYTKRIFARLGYIDEKISYADLRHWFMSQLPSDIGLFNQYHALIDALGHRLCLTRKPSCPQCPLEYLCKYDTR